VLYYGTHTLYRTINSAGLWTAVSPKLTNYNVDKRIGTISTIAIAQTNSEVIYVGTDDGNVWVTKDYGVNWKNISSTLPLRWVTRLTVDPKNENIVYVTFSGLRWAESEAHVFRSDNMGNSWNAITNGLPEAPVNAFAIDNNNSDILYLGNDVGAFISKDAGNNWEILGDNLPIVVVNDMKIHPTENYLAIGTHGRGMFKMDLNPLTNNKKVKNNLPETFSLSQNYPNPFNPTTVIEYSVPHTINDNFSSLKLIIYDVLGNEIKTLINKKQKPGNYKLTFDAAKLSSGIYYYNLSSESFSITKKMVLLK
ncbi:MAG: T9SS type A sorting domain-containing protein, partial [Ignavibacteriae bacterium]|nr:T9SS type A sorting domain-containing protein [Ignavibacteriota bacterium]